MNRSFPLLLLVACTAGETDETDTVDPASDLRTLDNCGTDVASGLPSFFQRFACVTATADGEDVAMHTVDLPPYTSPYYALSDPNWTAFDDRGGDWHQNPNFLASQDVTITFAASPTAKGLTITAEMVDGEAQTNDDEYGLGPAGIALNGVLLFNAVAAPGDDIADEAFTFDRYEGHPAPGGAYHYHGASPGPLEVQAARGAVGELYGMMCDGTVVLGCTELDGSDPAGALDAQGGHVHDLVDEGGVTELVDRYHTHVCAADGHLYTPEIQYYATCGS